MLSTFSSLLAFSIIGTTILRITLGIVLLILAWRTLKAAKTLSKHTGTQIFPIAIGMVETVISIFFLIGFYTQIIAITSFVLFIFLALTRRHFASTAIESRLFYSLLALVSITLIFLGPGLFAIDLPL